MKEKLSQKNVDNFCSLALFLLPLLLSCVVAAITFLPLSRTGATDEQHLLKCEKYGVFSKEKFAKLENEYFFYDCHKRDCKKVSKWTKKISDDYDEQRKLLQICINSSIAMTIEELPSSLKLYNEKEIQQIKNELMTANKKLEKEKEANKKFTNQEKQKFEKLKNAFIETSGSIEKRSFQLFGIPFDPFQRCLKNYNNLVERFAEIYNLEIE